MQPEHFNILTSAITKEECFKIIKSMSSNMSPGPESLPIQFYLTFGDDINKLLLHGYATSYEEDEFLKHKKHL